ncbi:MAG: DUF2283 domain-containing protein [Planctomycetes bacterium]|nr:DUF2283 domain-containing protein [Planctomycetota bacterium]
MKATASVHKRTGELGSLYVQFSSAHVAKTVPVKDPDDPDMLIDLDKSGRIVGMELLGMDILREVCKSIAKGMPKPYKGQLSELCPA